MAASTITIQRSQPQGATTFWRKTAKGKLQKGNRIDLDIETYTDMNM